MRKLPQDFSEFLTVFNGNGLTEVSGSGLASQSSFSQWSAENESGQALFDNTLDFAFHTDDETNPWWKVSFDKPQDLRFVVIENRRNVEFQHRAAGLRVSVEGPKGKAVVFEGQTSFGALPRQFPLIVSTNVRFLATTVTIEKLSSGYLHLSRVRLFADNYFSSFNEQKPIFFAANTDGLGERLKAIANARVLAKHLGGDFYFTWEPLRRPDEVLKTQSIKDSESTFASHFLDAHYWDQATFETAARFANHSGRAQDEALWPSSVHAQRVTQTLSPQQRDALNSRGVHIKSALQEAVRSIPFAHAVQQAIDIAESVLLPSDTTALHLRSGDVIYGPPRAVGRFASKCFPYPLVLDFIRRRIADGENIIVFGEDGDLLALLRDRYGVKLASDFASVDGSTERSLFEMVLMSRCDRIVAGSSGFAHFAGWWGQTNKNNLLKAYSEEQARTIIHSDLTSDGDLDGISSLQKAFAAWAGLYLCGDRLAQTEEGKDLLALAIRFDPTNGLYQLAEAVSQYAAGNGDSASKILRSSFEEYFASDECLNFMARSSRRIPRRRTAPRNPNYMAIIRPLESTTQNGLTAIADEWIDVLEAQAKSGEMMAIFALCLIRRAENQNTDADELLREFTARARKDDTAFVNFLLARCA